MSVEPSDAIPTRERLDRLVQSDPTAAIVEATVWRDGSPDDFDVQAQASTMIGRALFELGQVDRAMFEMHRAIDLAADAADAVRLPITMSAAAVLAERGAVNEAIAALDRARPAADHDLLGRWESQRAYVFHAAGALIDALECADRADELLRRGDDQLGLMRLVVNRGLIQLQRGQLDAAEVDFEDADRMALAQGLDAARGSIAGNLGVLHGRAQRIRESMAHFERARGFHARVGPTSRAAAVMEIDRAEVMLHAGLVADAVVAATDAARTLERVGNVVGLADAQLVLARAQLAAGQTRSAERTAAAAGRSFDASGRVPMVSHADAVRIEALLHQDIDETEARECIRRATRIIERLERSGWDRVAGELRLALLREGFRLGLIDAVTEHVERLRLGAGSEQRDIALAGWYAEAIAHAAVDDRARALSACVAGLSTVDEIVAEAPSLERRSAAMRLGHHLSGLAIHVAIVDGHAETVLAAAEGTRARALHDELAAERPHLPLTAADADDLRRELSTQLGDRTLVEFTVDRSSIWAVVFDRTGIRLVDVADVRTVLRARDRVLAWLDRAASEPDGPSGGALGAIDTLDQLLIAPLGLGIGDNGVVVVPVGMLHGLPWSGLPSLSSRAFSVAPSARMWLEADRATTPDDGSVALVVGPDTEGAASERDAIVRLRPDARVAVGAAATASTLRSMFEQSDAVHVAAHGRFSSGHPLLSTLTLGDGESTLYDTVPERVRSRLVILSCCEAGAQGISDGAEVLGMAAVMLSRGASAVFAPLSVVRDLECAEFVSEVHGELATGLSIGAATSAVRSRWFADDDLSRWAVAASFTTFGSAAASIRPT